MNLTQIVETLGLSLDAEEAQAMLAEFKLREDPYRSELYPEAVYYENESLGLALLSEDGVVDSIFLYSEGRDGFSQFRGTLPDGLTMGSTKTEVRAALGPPSASRAAVSLSTSLSHDGWDRFDLPSHSLHFTYDKAGEKIVLVTLSRR